MKLYFGGGVNENQYPSLIEASTGSYNFELAKDSTRFVPRAPFDLKGTATNTSDIRGIMQMVTRANVVTTLIQAGNTLYKWDGASVFSNVGSCISTSQLRDTYWSLNDYLVITDLQKLTVVKKWDGTTFSTLTTGLGATDLYAKYGMVWRGRVWLFNVTAGSDTPHLAVASKFEDPTVYDITLRAASTTFSATGGNEAFYMLTPDLRPINGVALFYDQMVVSTEGGKLFVLTGTGSTNYAFQEFYPKSNCVGAESVVSAGDDVYYMKYGGAIESLRSTQRFGDVATDDLSRYILSTTNGITSCITVYDQVRQKILFFVANKILVFFKDIHYDGALADDKGTKAKVSPWSIYKTQLAAGLNPAAVKYLRVPGGTAYTVYFGDSSGKIYDLNGTGTNGDGGTASTAGSAIVTERTTRLLDGRDDFKTMRHITKGTVDYNRIDQVNLSISIDWSDEYNQSTANVTLNGATAGSGGAYFGGSIYFGGPVYFSQGFSFLNRFSHKNFSVVGKGPGCTMAFVVESSMKFQVNNIEFK